MIMRLLSEVLNRQFCHFLSNHKKNNKNLKIFSSLYKLLVQEISIQVFLQEPRRF